MARRCRQALPRRGDFRARLCDHTDGTGRGRGPRGVAGAADTRAGDAALTIGRRRARGTPGVASSFEVRQVESGGRRAAHVMSVSPLPTTPGSTTRWTGDRRCSSRLDGAETLSEIARVRVGLAALTKVARPLPGHGHQRPRRIPFGLPRQGSTRDSHQRVHQCHRAWQRLADDGRTGFAPTAGPPGPRREDRSLQRRAPPVESRGRGAGSFPSTTMCTVGNGYVATWLRSGGNSIGGDYRGHTAGVLRSRRAGSSRTKAVNNWTTIVRRMATC